MIFGAKDLEMLLEKAVETNRNLTIIFNADGTYEISLDIPMKTTSTYETQAWKENKDENCN